MEEENRENEEDSTREGEGRNGKRRKDETGKILTLEGLEKYVQKFLRAIYDHPKSTDKERIYEAFLSLLGYSICEAFTNKKSKDPDHVIEQFIIERASWSHLAINVVEVQEHIKLYYEYSAMISQS